MSHFAFAPEAKAAIKANLELELKSRKEKLLAMCEAQVASLRSRLERRVNRIPASKRSMKLVDLLDAALPAPAKSVKSAPGKKQVAPAPAPAPVPIPARPAAPPAAVRKTRTAAAPTAKKEASKPVPKPAPAPKTIRGKKRPSDDGDKENEELTVPKKRAKIAAGPKPTTTRSTRAASRKAVPSQVLSPKPDNGRATVARTRRQR